jgi:hypothetical protein
MGRLFFSTRSTPRKSSVMVVEKREKLGWVLLLEENTKT